MANNIENNLGPQLISGLMAEHGLKPNDLARNSTKLGCSSSNPHFKLRERMQHHNKK